MGNRQTKNETEKRQTRRIYVGDVPDLEDALKGPQKEKEDHLHQHRRTSSDQTQRKRRFTFKRIVRRGSRQLSQTISAQPSHSHVRHSHFPSNRIISSRYTAWNFIPKNLFEQFRRIVNFYFLVMAIVQTVIDSPVSPITAVAPLAFVILVTAMKQGYEDWLRHKADENVNKRPVNLVKNGALKVTQAKDIKVGDVIKLEGEDAVPADMILLGSNEDFQKCQINTANLDGETNLKVRYCPPGIPHYKTEIDLVNLRLIIECEEPNEDLYAFTGTLYMPPDRLHSGRPSITDTTAAHGHSTRNDSRRFSDTAQSQLNMSTTSFHSVPLSMDNILLRGARLKNTEFIYGLIIYTGEHTRLAQNSKKTSNKFSTVERSVNNYLLFFILILMIMVCISTGLHFHYKNLDHFKKENAWYNQPDDDRDMSKNAGYIFNVFASFLILFNYIIPISLYVTMELQKFIGSKFFVYDLDMLDRKTDQAPLCNTSDLNEELGQIEYLFSDKTGTLTENVMEFRLCYVDSARFELRKDGLFLQDFSQNFERRVDPWRSPALRRFILVLALCHSVQVVPLRRPSAASAVTANAPSILKAFVKRTRKMSNKMKAASSLYNVMDSDIVGGKWEYQASSPDEKAILEACQRLGVVYLGEKEDMLSINVFGDVVNFKRHLVLEFDSVRKCMSVIVEDDKGEIWLLSKGAESSIIPRCDYGPRNESLKQIMDFAMLGLRTLAVAERKISSSEMKEIKDDLRKAQRIIKGRDDRMREIFQKIESHMRIIGCTGVEDKLQDNVADTLMALMAAGIRVWMLTGDKLETGVKVAISCGLITNSAKQIIVSDIVEAGEITRRFEEIRAELDPDDNTALIIDGDSLAAAFKFCPDLLRSVSMTAFRVVCCRMAPLQKAQVVHMVKNTKRRPVTAAVGDGANDVAMIQEAHIGLGIMGKEGRQAARCSDFALAKFSFLKKAILVHGHWFYVRLANLAIYFFYKNMVFILPQLFYCFNSAFSTQSLYNEMYLMMYNITFSACPIFVYGLLEQPHSAKVLMEKPFLYKQLRRNKLMTWKRFMSWLAFAVYHAIVCYFMTLLSWPFFFPMEDHSTFGTVVVCAVVSVTNLKMAIETRFVCWWYVFSQFFSFSTMFVFSTIYSEVDLSFFIQSGDFRGVYLKLMIKLPFWILMVLISVLALLPDILFKITSRSSRSLSKKLAKMPKLRTFYYPTPQDEIDQFEEELQSNRNTPSSSKNPSKKSVKIDENPVVEITTLTQKPSRVSSILKSRKSKTKSLKSNPESAEPVDPEKPILDPVPENPDPET